MVLYHLNWKSSDLSDSSSRKIIEEILLGPLIKGDTSLEILRPEQVFPILSSQREGKTAAVS
ncbi:6504_t:CDS:2, partial [Gigaspora rosea]